MSTISKQLALILVKEVIAEKRNNKIHPDYALGLEVGAKITEALNELVADGSLIARQASVNRLPAYEIPEAKSQPTL
ncbi:MAG: hypothetical protein OSJ33_08220 [Muribaculaceae bacterium]|nr:hypothetical protein [Muribaculaceae bacterium]